MGVVPCLRMMIVRNWDRNRAVVRITLFILEALHSELTNFMFRLVNRPLYFNQHVF